MQILTSMQLSDEEVQRLQAHTLVACPCYSAVFDFTPTEPDELHFSADEPIKVLEECTDGWMLGVKWHVLQQQPEKTAFVIGQEIGWFPGNYCAVADRSSSRKGSSDSQSHSQEEQEDRQGEGQGQAECDDDIELASSHDDDDDDEYLELDSSIDTEALIGHLVSEIVESVQEDHELVSALQEADDDYVSIGSQNEDNGEEVQEEEVAQEPQQDAHAQYDNPRAQSLHQTNPNPKPSPKHKPLRKQTSLSTHDLNKATSRQLGSAKRLPSRRASRESIYYFAVRSSLSELGPLQRPQCIEEEAVRATPSPPPALVAATPMSPPSSPSSQGRGRQSMTSDCMYASPQDAIVHENEEEKEDDDDLPALYPVAEEDSHTGATLAPRHSAIVQDPFRASDNYDNVREGRILAHKDSGLPQKSSKISLLAKISNSSAEDQNQVSKANRVVIAKYDCQAEDDDELEFVRGDVLIVTFRTEEDDWWKGYLQKDDSQTIKMIPKMFVRDLNEFEVQFFSSIKKKSSEKLLKMIQNKLPSRSASQRELTIVSETSRGARSSSQATEHVPAAAAPASPSSAVASPGPALHLYEDLDTTRQSVRRTPRPGRPAPPPPRGSKKKPVLSSPSSSAAEPVLPPRPKQSSAPPLPKRKASVRTRVAQQAPPSEPTTTPTTVSEPQPLQRRRSSSFRFRRRNKHSADAATLSDAMSTTSQGGDDATERPCGSAQRRPKSPRPNSIAYLSTSIESGHVSARSSMSIEGQSPIPRNSPIRAKRAPRPAIAVSDFIACKDDEISLKTGDVISLIYSPEDEARWKGRVGKDREGFFPSSYVKIISRRPQSASSADVSPLASPSRTK